MVDSLGTLSADIWANYGLELSTLTILYFDYILMLPDEIRYMWLSKRRGTIASWLFFLMRYVSLATHVPSIFAEFGMDLGSRTCTSLQRMHFYATVFMQFLTAVVFTLRVHALYSSRVVLGHLVALILASLGIAVWSIVLPHSDTGTTQFVVAVPGCNPLMQEAEALRLAITWSAVSAFDLVVFGLTLKKALESHWRNSSTLWFVFMRDGAMYFIVIFICNAGNILTFLLAPPILKGASGLATNIMSATLVCRLIINLRVTDARMRRRRSDETELQVVVSVSRRDELSPVTPQSPSFPWNSPSPVTRQPSFQPSSPWQPPSPWQSPAQQQSPVFRAPDAVPLLHMPVPPRQYAQQPRAPLTSALLPEPLHSPQLARRFPGKPVRPRPRALSEPWRPPEPRAREALAMVLPEDP